MTRPAFRALAALCCLAFLTSCTAPTRLPSTFAEAARTPVPDRAPVVIVGAGLTGLTTAYKLKAAGVPFVLLESSNRVGGRVQTVYFKNGTYAEAHMEEYFERSPAVALLRELKLELADDVAHSSVRIDGKIYPYQGDGDRETYLNGLFSADEKAALMKWNAATWKLYQSLHETAYHDKPLPPDLDRLREISFADHVKSANLPRKVSEWIRVLVEAETAIEWDQIAALDGIDEVRLFLDTPDGFGEKNYHVVGGNSRFTAALAQRIGVHHIATNAHVTTIEQTTDGVRVRYLRDGQRYADVLAKAVVLTPPVYALPGIQFIPPLSDAKQRAIKTTKFGAYVKVHLVVDDAAGKLWRDDKGETVLTLLSDSPAGSVYEASDFQEGLPATERTTDRILTLLMHANHARAMLNMTADEQRAHAVKSLDALFPGVAKHVKRAEVFAYPTAVAYWPLSLKRSRFDADARALRQPENGIHIGGDTTEDSHSEGAVQAGIRMANQLIAKKRELLAR
ncbi:MAG TPA: NAD(P)/FAD-dependent oxidoreductase [Tepidisphaeraceae bacterium]|nr:NAD(P)/FAD-dependent oxidoreductase [Tepidisphaeraceae bacterium]